MLNNRNNNIKRIFTIGDDWVYYKIYCGVVIANEILIEVIQPLVKDLIRKHIILKWFFIRYKDSESHLRIRFLLKDNKDFGFLIESMKLNLNHYIKSRKIWDLQIHTYKRELERYGNSNINVSESHFYFDSERIINALNSIPNDEEYFLFVIKNINNILSYFNYKNHQKLNLVEQMRNQFKKEFNVDKYTVKQLDQKYRTIKIRVNDELNISTHQCEDENHKKTSKNLLTNRLNNKLEIDPNELLTSYIHMSINRSFRTKQRLYELFVYDILYKFYKSKVSIK